MFKHLSLLQTKRQTDIAVWLTFLMASFFGLEKVSAQCAAPSSLSVSSISHQSARVTWVLPVGGATAYSWFVSTMQGNVVKSGSGPLTQATVTDLNAGTQYAVQIHTICSGGSLSNPLGPINFTTACTPVATPFTQNFNSAATNALPTCWTRLNGVANNAASWGAISVSSGNKQLRIAKYVMNDWVFTGGMNMEAGVSYTLSFDYEGAGSVAGTLAFYQGTTPTPIDMNASPLVSLSLTNQTGTSTSTFTPTTTGVYYFGWKATRNSSTSLMQMYLDNVKIEPTGCAVSPVLSGITGIAANTATGNWSNVAAASGYEWKVVLQGNGVGAGAEASGSVGAGVTNVTATGLPAGVYYDFYVRSKCGTINTSAWSAPITFQTIAQAELSASTNNDAYVALSWALPVAPCLLDGSGQAYSQGVHISLNDASTNQQIYDVNITDLSNYVGMQQPTFSSVVSAVNGSKYEVNAGVNAGADVSFWTLETWVKNGSGVNNAILFANNQSGTNQIRIKWVNAQEVRVELGASGTAYNFGVGSPAIIPAGKWVHLAFACTGGKIKLYVNGEFASEKDIASGDIGYTKLKNNGSGSRYTFFDNYANGQIGEVRLWKRIRSATEIKNDRFLTNISSVAQNDLLLWFKWTAAGGATSLVDDASVADGAATTTGTMATVMYSATPDYTPLTGNFKHYVGPTQNRNYTLNVYQYGTGAPTASCASLTASGSTLAYQPPVGFSATDNQLDRVTLSWINKSKLSESVKIYRNGGLYKIIAGTEEIDSPLTYTDVYTDGDSTSLASGKVYNYCIEAYSNVNNLNYTAPSQQCDSGRTDNINFAATDNVHPDKVVLTWASVEAYGYSLQINRDDQTIATLTAATTSYTDETPIYGKKSVYKLSLVNTLAGGAIVVAALDSGSVAARGVIAGRVSTNEGDYAVRNAMITLYSYADTIAKDTVYTDINGKFSFSNLYYDIEGDFDIKAHYQGHQFYANPVTVKLVDSKYSVTDLAIKDSTGFTQSSQSLPVSNFSLLPSATLNKVDVKWSYTSVANDTTVFNIYRDDILLGTVSNISNALASNYTYTDLTGMPLASYIYKIVGSRFVGGQVMKYAEQDTTLFPDVALPTTFTATPNAISNKVNLAWSNANNNISGYNIYRNGVLIADLPNTATTYSDLTATPALPPAMNVNYALKTKRFVENMTHESTGSKTATALAPALPSVASISGAANTARNSVVITFGVSGTGLNNVAYNFDGYRITRGTTLIGIVPKGTATTYTFEDKTGKGGSAYTYAVSPYKQTTDSTYSIATPSTTTATYPAVMAATSLTASSNRLHEVYLTWTPALDLNAANRNIDGQILTVSGTTDTVFLNAKENSYRYFTTNTASKTYSIRSYNIAPDGTLAVSAAATATGSATTSSTSIALPANFKATPALNGQAFLTWEYPIFVYSSFNIYRDSILLTNEPLPIGTLSFQDSAASDWNTHLYQIEAVNSGITTPRVGASVKTQSRYVLAGRVYSNSSRSGLAGVDVYANATRFTGRAITDSTGYYQISLPAQPNLSVTVMADAYNNAMTQLLQPYQASSLSAVQTITTSANDAQYQVNFGTTFISPNTNNESPASVAYISATANPAQRSVGVAWTFSNSDYDSVEVYRAATLLTKVAKNSTAIVWDKNGAPGISYFYQVRSVKMVDGAATYGEFGQATVTFPTLDTPKYIKSYNLANGIRIEWGHQWNNHTRYEVKRNDVLVATVMPNQALVYEDFTGKPSQNYIYEVRAVATVAGADYYSEPATVMLSFPNITEVSDLQVTVPTQMVTGLSSTTCGTNTSRSLNYVNVAWQYPSGNADGFLVYRDDKIIATLPKDSLSFKDYTGYPDVVYTYMVQSTRLIDSITYNSIGTSVSSILYPTLAAPYNVQLKDTLGMLRYRWFYPETNIKGFMVKIYEGSNLIDTDTVTLAQGKNNLFTYYHVDGIPGMQYRYEALAYDVRSGIAYYSAASQCASNYNAAGTLTGYGWTLTTYPSPLAPTAFAATDGTYDSYVKLTWQYAPESEITGFELYKNGVSVGTVVKGQREYNHLEFIGSTPFSARAYRLINGTKYYSDYSNIDNGNSKPLTSYITGTGLFGSSIDVYDNRLLVGNQSSNSISLYSFDANGNLNMNWQNTNPSSGYGKAVAMSNDMITVLANGSGGYHVLKYTPTGVGYQTSFGTANTPVSSITEEPSSLGISDISLSSNTFVGLGNTHPTIYGTPSAINNIGAVYLNIIGLGTGVWHTAINGFWFQNAGQIGSSVAITGRHAVAALPSNLGSYDPAIKEYYLPNTNDGASWEEIGELPLPSAIGSASKYGLGHGSIAYADDYNVVIGAYGAGNNNGKAFYFHRNGTTGTSYSGSNTPWSAPVEILNPSSSTTDGFGKAVDIQRGLILVGAPDLGKAYLYKEINGVWTLLNTFTNTTSTTGIVAMGKSVKVGKHHVILGGTGGFHFYPLGEVKPNSVIATKGTILNQTRIDWDFEGIQAEIEGFRIYRDGIVIGSVSPSDRFFFDDNGVPGKHYIYEVCVFHSDMEQRRYPAEGWSKENGVLAGSVVTLEGGGKVAGVTIKASALIEGSYYNYTAISNGNGEFNIPQVFYGGGTADYSVTATFKDHEFITNPITTQLSSTIPASQTLQFVDKVSYIISGYVSRLNTECGLDSIKITPYTVLTNGQREGLPAAYTNTEGKYSITVNPFLANLSHIEIQIDSMKEVSANGKKKNLKYKFAAQSNTIIPVTPSFAEINTLDFIDTLTYPVKFQVSNACKSPILGGQYIVRAKDEKGCYNQSFTTDNEGFVSANLPAINLTLNVEGVENLTQQSELVVNYLRYRPQVLKLYDLHRDTLQTSAVLNNTDTPTTFDTLTKQYFTYYTPPTITVQQGFGRYLCNDLSKAAIVESGKNYTLRFSIESLYNGTMCDNKLGKIIITNAAATQQLDSVFYSDDFEAYPGAPKGGFLPYKFTASIPNLVEPYAYTMNVEYRTKEGEILGIKNFAIIVEGSSALPGSDVIVDLGSAEKIKLPVYVLRKPPGDNSSASIEQGTSVSFEFSESYNWGGGAGIWGEFEPGPVVIAFETMFGRDNNSSYLSSATFSTTTGISTSGMSEKGKTKDASDVIVGTGIAAQYGLSQTIKVEDNNCKINKFTSLQFSPNSLQTTWMYTVNHIQHLIDGYEIQKKQVEAGTLLIKDKSGKVLPKAVAKLQLDGYITGWNKVLGYHRKETLPWYDLCSHDIPAYIGSDRSNRIKEWRNGYCKDEQFMPGGQYINDKFSIKKEKEKEFLAMEWSDKRIRAYNSARTAIYHLEYVYPTTDGGYSSGFNNNSGKDYTWFLDNWKYEKAKLTDSTKAANLLELAATITQNGKPLLGATPAKNITFSGGVEYSESQENTMATSNSYDAQFFMDLNLKVAFAFSTEASTTAVPVEVNVLNLSNFLGVMANFHYSYTSARAQGSERTNTSSFTLSDDDEFDQYSVTCIQGVNPAHTPYFALLGGRSSCPQEIGAIQRDRPDIRLYDEASNSTGFHQNRYFVKADEPAIFKVRLTNRNLFNEARELKIKLDNTSNPDGAEVYLGGTQLGEMIFELDPETPFDVELKILRGAEAYRYDSIALEVGPACDEDEMTVDDPSLSTKITVNVFFDSPCSDITLLDPEDGWQIKRRNPFDPNDREQMLIKFTDYDTDNENLKSVRLEYRRRGAGQSWTTINGADFTADSLKSWNALNFLPGALKYYPFFWDITGNYTAFPDGEYEIRAVAECELKGQMTSDVIRGSIYRNTNLLGNPEPSDRVWTTGDEISVAYIADIDCPSTTGNVFTVTDITTNQPVAGQVVCHNNKVSFIPTNNMRTYNGDSLRMIVSNVMDYQGNNLDSVSWTFKVVSSDMYVGDNIIDVTVEQGAKVDVSTFLVNNREDGVPLTYSISNLAAYSTWLSSKNATGTILVGMPEQVTFTVNAATLPIDSVKAFLNVVANGVTYPNAIQVRVRVLPKSPNWVVNTSLYEQNMTVISNFILNSSQATRSTDSTDVISVWIGNEVRGVAKISKITSTIYNAIISVYGNTADANKALSFRVWDSSTGSEYDARPLPTATVPFTSNGIRGSLSSPLILNVVTASDKATYIPLNKGWTMFSINKQTWNVPVNTALTSLKYRTNGDIIKTANKSASFSSTTNTWTSANGLDSANVHRGYMIKLANADTLRITGAAATIKPITLNVGWNLIGYPVQTELPIANAMVFSVASPDTMWLKTVPQNTGVYSRNMVANFYAGSWKSAFSSNMDKIRPNFAYWLKVKNTAMQLRYPGYTGAAVSLLRVTNDGSNAHPEYPDTWGVNPANYEHNMLIHGAITIDKHQEQDTTSLVAAFVGDECRGVGKLTYLPEEKKYVMAMFVYSNKTAEEDIDFRIYSGEHGKVYRHYESITFTQDSVLGSFEQTYKFSNVAPDNTFFVAAYPNPFENKFKVNIQSDKAQTFTLRLVDIAGHKLIEQSIKEEVTEVTILLNTQSLKLTQGVYFLQVIGSKGETTTVKMMK